MHIAFLTSEYPNPQKPEGGLGNYIRKVSLALTERGHCASVYILGSEYYNKMDRGVQLHYIKRKKFHWRLHSIKKLHPWLNLVEDRVNANRLKRAVLIEHRNAHIDILQTPNYKAPGLSLCHNGQFPVVCRCSSYQPLMRSANGGKKSLADAIADYFEGRQLFKADAGFSPSAFIARTYERFEGVRPVVIRTPLMLEEIEADPSIYQERLLGTKYLLYFGALNGIKGVDLLLKAIPEILGKNPDLHFVLVGRNDQLPERIKAFDVIQRDLHEFYEFKRLLYFPSLPHAQLFSIIRNALGVVLPSRVDNYPNACLEALMLGVPVVGTYHSSLDEMIEDGKTGFLARNSDVPSLINAIGKLLNLDPTQRDEMIDDIHSEISRIRGEDRVGRLLQFYQETVSKFKQAK